MAPVALSRILSFAALLTSYAAAQAPTQSGTSGAPGSSITAPPTASAPLAATTPVSTFPATPLVDKHFTYPSGIPYQVDPETDLIRGPQSGYNICNSTTEGPNSRCQTMFFSSIDDFCLWGPPVLNGLVADNEGEMVAYCTKPGRGTRLIPANALQGVQWIKTPSYISAVGFINQAMIDMNSTDYGGELDPHGADLRGNPKGGLVFSQAYTPGQWEQISEWNNFMGANTFCFKACDPSVAGSRKYCQNIYDRIGCAYNIPSNAQNGTFEVCQGDNQDPPGIYTSNGVVMTYTQPPESLGPITTMPYTPVVPASSSCTQYQSSSLYTAIATVSPPGATSTASGSGSSGAKPSGSGSGSGSKGSGSSNGATTLAISGLSFMGVVFSALFLS
ncbi:hypothetical protein APHAL10511_004252 [Amanita phalloides]|nr:hypothetical protein APHAL10511_004252 [Amanita phalloides]